MIINAAIPLIDPHRNIGLRVVDGASGKEILQVINSALSDKSWPYAHYNGQNQPMIIILTCRSSVADLSDLVVV